jgi:hydrogenase-4 transcriptional activator
VLIAGETGTGKEIVAQEVHELSKRSQRRFIAFNVSAVPRDMLEGQLFGYRRGAFTGAVVDAKGLIREAEGGTLFIDEIGELDADLQPKLLRFLESGEIQPIGERPQRVDVRIVAATNAKLEELVRAGRFREDLFYRLNVVSLTIPPLRDRREEIPTLVNHFLTTHARQAGKPIPQLTPQALERLSAYEWPGNVRQLTNELKRIVALSDADELVDVAHLSPGIRHPPPASASPQDGSTCSIRLDRPLHQLYADVERAAIARAMERSSNNQADTATLLGITRKGLYLKRRRLGLDEQASS